MAQQSGGGAVRKKLASSSAAVADAYTGEDRISALPDDLLVLILLCLGTTAEAVRTSVLSHRWRPVWKRLPVLRFDNGPDLHRIRELIDVPDPDPEALAPPELNFLSVKTEGADPESAAAWLPAAARRVTGNLVFHNGDLTGADGFHQDFRQGRPGAVQVPCFSKTGGIELDLGFLVVALPSTGTFTRLTELRFYRVLFQGRPCHLGDVVSSPRCPSLQILTVQACRGIDADELTIRSESLLRVYLAHLAGFQRLIMVTPALQLLDVANCLENYDQEDYENNGDNGGGVVESNANDPIVHITAPQLESMLWNDKYYPQSVQFSNVEQLKDLRSFLYVYLQQDDDLNDNCQRLLQRFQVVERLNLLLVFHKDLADDLQYVMGDITMLPKILSLELRVDNKSHAFGACCFHLLRMCTSIQKMAIQFLGTRNLEVQYFCPSGCLCEQPTEWKTERLTLMHLQEVVIINTNGTIHEIAIFKRLFDWAVKLKWLRLMYYSKNESKVNEMHQKLQSFARPETWITLEQLPEY